ncbi:MAG: YgiT-type zinc finger protein [Vicinamibacterales bacterium]
MCGELMRLVVRDRGETIPGTRQTVKREVREWVCPECDYFEEVEEG